MRFLHHWKSVCGEVLAGMLMCVVGWPALAASPADGDRLAAADTGFAFGLVKELAREQPAKNVFISPYSISTVLQMVCNGAAGSTKQEMASVLGTSGLEAQALNQACKELDQSIRSAQSNVVLSIANAIWYRVGVELRPTFVSVNQDFFGAKMDALDFTDPRSSGIINTWADENTHGRIKQIISGSIPGDAQVILANAIYFKGSWERKFDPKATKERAFHLRDGRQPQVPMMAQSGEFQYQEGNGCQAVRLPYAGGRLAMCVLLPEPGSSAEKLLASLDAQVWQSQLRPRFLSRRGSLVFPCFKLEYGAELKRPLTAMGMTLPFSRGADFSGMSPTPLYLSEVRHKSFVEVNEEGTEAAAVTLGVMRHSSVQRPIAPFEMVVDRPFLFVIEDNLTNAILFVGVVFDPTGPS
jgi:serine protease inhibitor